MSLYDRIKNKEIRIDVIQKAVKNINDRFNEAAENLDLDLMSKLSAQTIDATMLICNEKDLPEWIITAAKDAK